MSQIIPLGIGSPSGETQLLLTGLSIFVLGENSTVAELMNGVPLAISQTTAYALPGRTVRIQATQSIDVSVDAIAWTVLTNATTSGQTTSAMFVRCTVSTTCVVVCKVI